MEMALSATSKMAQLLPQKSLKTKTYSTFLLIVQIAYRKFTYRHRMTGGTFFEKLVSDLPHKLSVLAELPINLW